MRSALSVDRNGFATFSALRLGALMVIIVALGTIAVVWWQRASTPPSMTFEVTVPKNTFPEDRVFLYLHTHEKYRMEKVGDFVHRVSLTEDQLQPQGDTIRYRYSRNGYNYRTAEYLEPDTNDYFWTALGRKTLFRPGSVQRDTVVRWRWFPIGALPARTSELIPHVEFLPRINGELFRSGQIIEDLYDDAFSNFFASTAAHLQQVGYRWAEIDPPWQLVERDGLPKVVNLFRENPNYPDDETLLAEIRAFKERGLRVMLGPQLCCETIDFRNRSPAWWDAYFRATTDFLVHHADLAERAGVDTFHYAVNTESLELPDVAERWRNVFREVRKHFSGEVGEMVWSNAALPGNIVPDLGALSWGDELDYFLIAVDAPLSLKNDPTDEELLQGAAALLDGQLRALHEKYGKPIIVRTTYFAVQKAWRGSSFYSISSVPWVDSEERALTEGPYTYGPEDQARVVNAFFRAIAERPWIIGYAQFGYEHWENPLVPGLSIRGKPAEDIWKKWNDVLFRGNQTD